MAGWAVRVTACLLLTGLVGCAGGSNTGGPGRGRPAKAAAEGGHGRVQQIAYVPPGADAPLPPSLDTPQTAWDIEQQVAANVGAIADASLGPSRAGSVMTILYSGDPRDLSIAARSACGPPRATRPSR